MKWNKQFIYPKSVRSIIDEERHYSVDDEKLPSVTTILAATQSDEKRESLQKWKDRVGSTEADNIKNTAATRGTAMHSYLEAHLNGQGLLDLSDLGQAAGSMARTIIDKGLGDLHEIWGSEVVLHYPGLYAGATDLCGVYQGRDSIVDFKQSNKPKKEEWIEDYKLQLAGYALAHNEVYGTNIQKGVNLICTTDNFYQEFIFDGEEFKQAKYEFLKRVDMYYNQKSKEISG